MSSEENYLDDLLNNVLEPKTAEPMEKVQSDNEIEDGVVEKSDILQEEPIVEKNTEAEVMTVEENGVPDVDIEDINIEDIETEDIGTEDINIEDIGIENVGVEDIELEDIAIEDIENATEELEIEAFDIEENSTEEKAIEEPEIEALNIEESVTEEKAAEEPEIEALDTEESSTEEIGIEEAGLEKSDTEEVVIEEVNMEEAVTEDSGTEALPTEELLIEDSDVQMTEEPLSDVQISDTGENLNLEGIEMPESEDEFKLEDIEMPDMPDEESQQDDEMDIDGLDTAIQSETELEMAGALDMDELQLDDSDMDLSEFDMADMDLSELSEEELNELSMSDLDVPEETPVSSGETEEKEVAINMDDNLEDVLNMLDDDDAELAEINDMLKKSDNNEPIQDDMMNLLHQMADDEAASVNAGVKNVDEDDDEGVPLPEIPQSVLNASQDEKTSESEEDTKKKGKKASLKKKNSDDADEGSKKEPGKLGKLFNLLTEELVPEPTEEELVAEKAAKDAKKQENLTKKEEEKLAKDEAKKAKAEEQEAAKKAKQEAAAQKKKEKQAQKEAKAAAKKAKQEAEGPKKRIPPKKIAAGAAFGASVGGALIIATNVLSTQGFLQTARNAYYDEDYKTVYQATFGMELDDSQNDGLIKERSEVIYKVQRRYDSYQNNLKMGREVEALDALLQGISAYDYVNADAEKYDVLAEVDAIKTEILNVLQTKYNLDEAAARELINTEDALTYTIALNYVIAAN